MAMTETQRTTLYNQLAGALGPEAATSLMQQLPPSGWDQVATKDDVKASEKLLQRELKASEKMLVGELTESEGRLMLQIADSESRQGARIDQTSTRIDETNNRIDQANNRIDETNQALSELKDEVRNGFAGLKLALARHTLWMVVAVVSVAASLAVPLVIALI
jgi:wobble nucleotide-excising tRNase